MSFLLDDSLSLVAVLFFHDKNLTTDLEEVVPANTFRYLGQE